MIIIISYILHGVHATVLQLYLVGTIDTYVVSCFGIYGCVQWDVQFRDEYY